MEIRISDEVFADSPHDAIQRANWAFIRSQHSLELRLTHSEADEDFWYRGFSTGHGKYRVELEYRVTGYVE